MDSTFYTSVELWRRGVFEAYMVYCAVEHNQRLLDGANKLMCQSSLTALTLLYDELYPKHKFPVKEVKVSKTQTVYSISLYGYLIRLRVTVHKVDGAPYFKDYYPDGTVIGGHRYCLQLNMIHSRNRAPISFRSVYFLPEREISPVVGDGSFAEGTSLKLFRLFLLLEYFSHVHHSV